MASKEPNLIQALGIADDFPVLEHASASGDDTGHQAETYQVVPDPASEATDLSNLRGVVTSDDKTKKQKNSETSELENLAELVPDIRRRSAAEEENATAAYIDIARAVENSGEVIKVTAEPTAATGVNDASKRGNPSPVSRKSLALKSKDGEADTKTGGAGARTGDQHTYGRGTVGFIQSPKDEETSFNYADSDHALEDEDHQGEDGKVPKEFMNMSSAQSLSTATQTHEVRMPMFLPNFKPATGCTNASDFIVRCFVARLRSGITVVKHGRSRWCKSRLRILHIHPDGRSLSWKPAEGEPKSSKRPPKLDLSTCLEVRHAWSPDPQNPMYTGTAILRQKCEAANAHKSFALIFKQRTVDITAVTADQCKVLMEGFSALCFRLQVANLAGSAKKGQVHRPMPEEDGVSTTASATLTNKSATRGVTRQ